MAKEGHKPEEIVAKLRQVDVLVSRGRSVADAIRAIGVTEVTFYLYGLLPVWTAPLAQASFGLGRVGQFAYLYPASWERSQRPNGESARAGLNRWPAYEWPR